MCDIYFNGKVLGGILTEIGYPKYSKFEVEAGIGGNTVCGFIRKNVKITFKTRKKIIDALDTLRPDWKETESYKSYIKMKSNPKFDRMTPESLKRLIDETGETLTHFGAMCGITHTTVSKFIKGNSVSKRSYKSMCGVYKEIKCRLNNADAVQIHAEYPCDEETDDDYSEEETFDNHETDETIYESNNDNCCGNSNIIFTDDEMKMIETICMIKGIEIEEYLHKCVIETTKKYFEIMKGAIN